MGPKLTGLTDSRDKMVTDKSFIHYCLFGSDKTVFFLNLQLNNENGNEYVTNPEI